VAAATAFIPKKDEVRVGKIRGVPTTLAYGPTRYKGCESPKMVM
jgi:hypothetical protein